MKKIISLFQRNYETDRLVRDEVVPGAEWVLTGEGVATRKYDGTCVLVRDGKCFKRHEIKAGGKVPAGFEPANDVDAVTGKQQGWVPVGDGPDDRWHREVRDRSGPGYYPDGTYELVGPKVQGNPERCDVHIVVKHGDAELPDAPRTFAGLRDYFAAHDIEGVVWHHPDGRMVKIKAKDFGIKRGAAMTLPPVLCDAFVDQGRTIGGDPVGYKCANAAAERYWHEGAYWWLCRSCLDMLRFAPHRIMLKAWNAKLGEG